MTKSFPTDAKTQLIIADDVRHEAGGKLSIMGIYPSETVVVTVQPNTPIVIPSLCLLWRFTDGEGDFDAQLSISTPSGEQITNTLQQVKKINGEMNLIIKLSPFVAKAPGVFTCRVLLDGHNYKRELKLVDAAAYSIVH